MQKLRRKLAELEQSLTVVLALPDGEGSYERVRKRRRDFPMDRPNEDDDGHVRYELRQVDAQPVANASWRRPRGGDASSSSSQQPFGIFKVVSKRGNEVCAERSYEQTLRDDQPGGRKEV